MKTIKNLSALFLAAIFVLSVSAQSSTSQPASGKTKSQTAATGDKGTSGAKTPAPAEKSTDKVDASQKGPTGETVYIGSKGGKYYLSKTGKKVYDWKGKK